jgi:osmotically-inducible protein OsmY
MEGSPLYENVANDLDVELPSHHRRDDPEVRADVVEALRADAVLPDSVDASVTDGVVTLTGTADRQSQRKEAEFVARTIMGVADDIELIGPTPSSQQVKQSIREALRTDAGLDWDSIVVTTSPGTVTLSGTVHSWDERHAAVAAASDVAGVRTVHDRPTISD